MIQFGFRNAVARLKDRALRDRQDLVAAFRGLTILPQMVACDHQISKRISSSATDSPTSRTSKSLSSLATLTLPRQT
jgi:hypothetical protein